jgi:hypothetical protein
MASTRLLKTLAKVIRSKNAGPFEITFDIMFDEADVYDRVKNSGVLCPELFARLYRITSDRVLRVEPFDPALSIKATIVRTVSSGTVGDSDVFGAQQHAPLLDIEIPWD